MFIDEETKALLDRLEEKHEQFLSFLILKLVEVWMKHRVSIETRSCAIVVEKADGETCERCWIVTPEIGQNEKHPTLCETMCLHCRKYINK